MEQYTYLLVDALSVLVPFLFSFHPKLRFVEKWKRFWPACLIIAVIFLIWDYYFTHMGVWGFNQRYLVGWMLGKIPVEEILFFICIPYSCVFTYHCLNILVKKDVLKPVERNISFSLGVLLFILGTIYHEKWYTSVTFIGTGTFLLLHVFYWKFQWMSRFYFCYISILPFFFLTNGILTGGFTEEPVVWYNNDENLGIRMFTIPVEDLFYGLLMLSTNVALYEFRSAKRKQALSHFSPRSKQPIS